MPPTPHKDAPDGLDVEHSLRFMLGGLMATVNAIKEQMNRIENNTNKELSDVKKMISDSLAPVTKRVETLESEQKQAASTMARHTTIIGGMGAFIGAAVSAIINKIIT